MALPVNDTQRAAEGKPLWKNVKGSGKVSRLERKGVTDRAAERQAQIDRVNENRTLAAIRRAIYERDKGCCRVCGRVMALEHPNPKMQMHWHHIVYRSAGGPNTVENGLSLCWRDHQREHAHTLVIKGTGALVTITERHPETYRVLREWESRAA